MALDRHPGDASDFDRELRKGPQDDIIDVAATHADWEGDDQLEAQTQVAQAREVAKHPEATREIIGTAAIRRLGALTVEAEESIQIDNVLADQRNFYESATKKELIETLLERDRTAMLEGRNLARGQTQTNLLREILRGVLLQSDHAQLRQIGDATKTGKVEDILEAIGCPPADARQLKLHGSTLGKLDDGIDVVDRGKSPLRLTFDETQGKFAGTGADALDKIEKDRQSER